LPQSKFDWPQSSCRGHLCRIGANLLPGGLRREAERGLVIERLAGKDYTTLCQHRHDEEAMPQIHRGLRLVLRPARRDEHGRNHDRPEETARRAKGLLAFFADRTPSAVNGKQCREYAASAVERAAATPAGELASGHRSSSPPEHYRAPLAFSGSACSSHSFRRRLT